MSERADQRTKQLEWQRLEDPGVDSIKGKRSNWHCVGDSHLIGHTDFLFPH